MIECPHCGGAIDVVIGTKPPDRRQTELPFIFELACPIKNAKKVIDAFGAGNHSLTRARAHDHVLHGHAHESIKIPLDHEHDHVHGELTSAQQDLLDQIEELIAAENRTQHFRTTWIMRVQEYPNQVFAAIGEARTAKREGRIRKSVGGVLNWHFEKFREGARTQRNSKRAIC